MGSRIGFLCGLAALLLAPLLDAAEAVPELTFGAHDRVLVLAPHPDDEVLGCGGVIQQALASKLPVRVVFLTYGDHNEWAFMIYRKHPVIEPGAVRRLGMVRHDEAVAAAKVLGLSSDELIFLGYPDLGTLPIWSSHWNHQPPFHSRLTGTATVPYTNAFRPGAFYRGEEILRDLVTVLTEFRPTKIFVSHPADHHPDHRALYLFTTVALWNLQGAIEAELLPYLIHYGTWPHPKGMHEELALDPPASLREPIRWIRDPVTPAMVQRNESALKEHRSQYEYSPHRLMALIRANELFGNLPPVSIRRASADTGPTQSTLQPMLEPPTELVAEDRLIIERSGAALEKDELVLMIEHTRPLVEATELSIFAFGYRTDKPFGEMPKLRVDVAARQHELHDQDKRLAGETVIVERRARQTIFKIRLPAIGNPERVLLSARTHLGDLPVDWTCWRILELPQDKLPQQSIK